MIDLGTVEILDEKPEVFDKKYTEAEKKNTEENKVTDSCSVDFKELEIYLNKENGTAKIKEKGNITIIKTGVQFAHHCLFEVFQDKVKEAVKEKANKSRAR